MVPTARPEPGADETDPLAGGLRKLPLQARSKAMVEQVLAAAQELVEEVGYEAVVGSPTLLLERSGVSRGSFYAFFDSPEGVLDELSYASMKASVANLDDALRRCPGRRWQEVCDVVFDLYLSEYRTPLVRELWVRQHLTSRARALDHRVIDLLADQVCAALKGFAPRFADLTRLHCRVALHALERLMQLAFHDDEDGDQAVVDEARTMLTGYFAGLSGDGDAASRSRR